MLVMEADIDNVKTDTGKTYCIGMGSYSVFKNVSKISSASHSPIVLPPIHKIFASLCILVIFDK